MVLTFYYQPKRFPLIDSIDEGVSVDDMWNNDLLAVDVKLDEKKEGREELIEKFKAYPQSVMLGRDYFRVDVTKLTNEEKQELLQLLKEVERWIEA